MILISKFRYRHSETWESPSEDRVFRFVLILLIEDGSKQLSEQKLPLSSLVKYMLGSSK